MCSYSAFISSFQKMLFQLLQILNNVILKQKREFEKKNRIWKSSSVCIH